MAVGMKRRIAAALVVLARRRGRRGGLYRGRAGHRVPPAGCGRRGGPGRRADQRSHRGLQRRHRAQPRLDARPPQAGRDLSSPWGPQGSLSRPARRVGARPFRDPTPRTTGRCEPRARPPGSGRGTLRHIRPAGRVAARAPQAGGRSVSRRPDHARAALGPPRPRARRSARRRALPGGAVPGRARPGRRGTQSPRAIRGPAAGVHSRPRSPGHRVSTQRASCGCHRTARGACRAGPRSSRTADRARPRIC